MRRFVFSLFGILLFQLPVIHAAEWVVKGTLNPTLSYDNNVFMSTTNKSGSFRTNISPAIFFSREQDDNSQSLSLGYTIDRYTALSRLNRQDPFIKFDSGFQTERSSWGLAASYTKSSSRSNAVEDTGDFKTDATLTSTTLSPTYRYQLTEKDNILLGGNYSKRDYSTTDFSNNKTKSLNAGWQHQFSERFRGGLFTSISNYKSKGISLVTEDDSYILSLTADYDISELWKVGGKLGVRRLDSQRQDSSGINKSNSSGTSLDINTSRRSERDKVGLLISRALIPSSTGDVNETDKVHLSWSHFLTEILTTHISASYQKTQSASLKTIGNRKNLDFSSSLTWQIQQNMGIDFAYHYRQQKQSSNGTNARSHAILMTLNYDWDGIRASR